MRVSKGDVSHGDVRAESLRGGDSDVFISQCGASNRMQGLVPDHQLVLNSQALADGKERPPLTLLGTLPVTDVDGGRVVVSHCQRGTDTGIHASAKQHDGAGFTAFIRHGSIQWFDSDVFLSGMVRSIMSDQRGRTGRQTPFTAGSQMNLCN